MGNISQRAHSDYAPCVGIPQARPCWPKLVGIPIGIARTARVQLAFSRTSCKLYWPKGDAALHEAIQTAWPLDAEAAFGVLPNRLRLHADPDSPATV